MSDVNSTTEVEYRPIEGFPGYRIGDDGSVWSCRKRGRKPGLTNIWRKLTWKMDSNGYPFVSLAIGNSDCRQVNVHRLVLIAFKGPCPPGMEAAHDNGIRTDNRPSNLAWKTHAKNMEDLERHGTKSSRLTVDQVREIRKAPQKRGTVTALARKFGVSHGAIHLVRTGRSWLNVS